MQMEYDARKKSVLVAYLAWFFLGGLGVHRFYAGRGGSGGVQLGLFIGGWVLLAAGVGFVFLLLLALWVFVDLFLVPGLVRDYNVRLARSLQSMEQQAVQMQPAHGTRQLTAAEWQDRQ